jgi:hypothetical protein
MIVRRVSCSIVVVGVVVGRVVSRVVSSSRYVIRDITNHVLSEYKHKNFYLSKYHTIKEYFPHYPKNK